MSKSREYFRFSSINVVFLFDFAFVQFLLLVLKITIQEILQSIALIWDHPFSSHFFEEAFHFQYLLLHLLEER